MGARGASGGADHTDLFPALDHRAFGNVDAIQMEVERVEAEAVIERDEAAGEEEVADEGHASTVRGHDGSAALGAEVDARMGHPRLAVDDASCAEARSRVLARHRAREESVPQPFRRDGLVERSETRCFGSRAPLDFGIEIHHRCRKGEALNGELARLDYDLAGALA